MNTSKTQITNMIKREKEDNPNIVLMLYKVYYITKNRTHCTKKAYFLIRDICDID